MEEELEYEINDAPITNTGSLKSSHKIGQKDNSEENNMGPSTEKEKLPINSDSETKKKSLLAGMTGIEEEKTYLIQKLSEKNEEIKKNIFIIEKQEKNHKELLEELEKYKGMEGSITNYKMMIENMNAEKELLREKVSLSENEQRNLQEEIKQQQLKIKEVS